MLKTKVTCFRCRQEVDTTMVRPLPSITKDPRYECYNCYQKHKRDPLLAGVEKPSLKRNFYCQQCNYTFRSKIKACPLCNKSEFLIEGTVSLKDLME